MYRRLSTSLKMLKRREYTPLCPVDAIARPFFSPTLRSQQFPRMSDVKFCHQHHYARNLRTSIEPPSYYPGTPGTPNTTPFTITLLPLNSLALPPLYGSSHLPSLFPSHLTRYVSAKSNYSMLDAPMSLTV